MPDAIPPVAPVIPPADAPLSTTALALLPEVQTHLDQLALLPPGPAAESKKDVLMSLILAIAKNPAVQAAIPQVVAWLSPTARIWILGVAGVIALVLGGGTVGRYVVPNVPATSQVDQQKIEETIKTAVKDAVKTSVVSPPVIAPPMVAPAVVAPHKITVYRTKDTDAKELAKLPPEVTVNPVMHLPGTTYSFNGKLIVMPCAELADHTGKVIDVRPFSTAAELAAWVKEK
jgi:hypothetical protein